MSRSWPTGRRSYCSARADRCAKRMLPDLSTSASRRGPRHAIQRRRQIAVCEPRRSTAMHREATMDQDRRTFLKTTTLAALARSRLRRRPTARQAARARSCRGPDLGTLRRPDGLGLACAPSAASSTSPPPSRIFARTRRPRIDAVFKGQGDVAGAQAPGRQGARERTAERHFVAPDKAEFGPCVTNPEKIVCVGLNYRKHAAETGHPVPKQPILFNKYNTALNRPRRHRSACRRRTRSSSTTRSSW